MLRFITSAVLSAAVMLVGTGVQAKPPGGSSSGSHSGNHSGNQGMSKSGSSSHHDSKSHDSKSHDSKSHDSHKDKSYSKDYHTKYGKKYSFGYSYFGKDHYHWSYQCYWPRYSCDCYYCPSSYCWYYWCEPRVCYLPTTCVEYAPPTVAVNVNNTATAVNNVGGALSGPPGDLPPVIPTGPGGAGPVSGYKGGPGKP